MIKPAFSRLPKSALDRAAEFCGTSSRNLKQLEANENAVFEFHAGSQTKILRLTHSSHRDLRAVLAELDWILYLDRNEIPCARPLESRNGSLSERIELEDGYLTACIFEKAPGIKLKVWNEKLLIALGKLVGRIHFATKGYAPSEGMPKRHLWLEESLFRAGQIIPSQDSILHKCQQMSYSLHRLSTNSENFGLIHADIHEGNFHVQGSKITLFDFDDCHYSWFVNDIAILLYESTVKHQIEKSDFSTMIDCFTLGYSQHNCLPSDWREQLELFLKLRNIYVYLFFHSKLDLNHLTERRKTHLERLKRRIEEDRVLVPIQ
ncbi:MAG: phosphotransferase [Pseudomonadota bacterium]